MSKSVIILSSRADKPIIDPPVFYEVWTMNVGYRKVTRVDRLFEMHDYEWRKGVKGSHHTYYPEMQKLKCPIYMQKHYPEFPSSIPYPVNRIMAGWPYMIARLNPEELFASTAAYMFALAIHEEYNEITCDSFEEKTDVIRSNIAFWMGLAIGKDIRVTFIEDDYPFKAKYRYGYGEKEYVEATGTWDHGEPLEKKK